MPARDIVAIGASAGGLAPLTEIVSQLPEDFPASVFVVLHLSPHSPSRLVDLLASRSSLPVRWAEDEEALRPGRIVVAPANRHLLLQPAQTRVLFGARESGARPSVDVLFRSAAVAYHRRVVGVILSGTLDDGARGLFAIKRCGGNAVVLDPASAQEPEMPRSALRETEVDHCLAAHEIGPLLRELVRQQVAADAEIPEEVAVEDRAAQNAMTGPPASHAGEATSLACPDCGGELHQFGGGRDAHYRCHVGHAYSTRRLLDQQREQLEQGAWTALRVIADRQRVLERLADDYRRKQRPRMAESMAGRAEELAQQAASLRNLLAQLLQPESAWQETELSTLRE